MNSIDSSVVSSFSKPPLPSFASVNSAAVPLSMSLPVNASTTPIPSFHSPFTSLIQQPSPQQRSATPLTTQSTQSFPSLQPSGQKCLAPTRSNSSPASTFTSPFTSLTSSPHVQPAAGFNAQANGSGNTVVGGSTSPAPVPSFPSHTAQLLSAFPPPSFGTTSASSSPPPAATSSIMNFPAPSFATPSSGVSSGSAGTPLPAAIASFPLHLATSASAPVSHASSFPSSHMQSGSQSREASRAASAEVSKATSPHLGPSKAHDANSLLFTPLTAAATGRNQRSVGVFSAAPSPASAQGNVVGLPAFGFPTHASHTDQLSIPNGHHSLSATPAPLSLPGSSVPSPMPSPKVFSNSSSGAVSGTSTPGQSSSMYFPKAVISQSLNLRPLTIYSENSSARTTPIPQHHLPQHHLKSSSRRPSTASIAEHGAMLDVNAPAIVPSFPPHLRAKDCSELASLLAPEGSSFPATPSTTPLPFFATVSVNGTQMSRSNSKEAKEAGEKQALATVIEHMNFSIESLVIQTAKQMAANNSADTDEKSVATATPAPVPSVIIAESVGLLTHLTSSSTATSAPTAFAAFDFNSPSPDDVSRARLQSLATPNRGATTDAPSLADRERKAEKKRRVKGTGGRFIRPGEQLDEEEEAFLHATERRAAMGGMLQLSSGSVGADGAARNKAANAATDSATATLASLNATSREMFASRPFQALHRHMLLLKRPILEELYRGACTAAAILGSLVREPRRKELQRMAKKEETAPDGNQNIKTVQGDSPTPAEIAAMAEEPYFPKAAPILSTAGSVAPSSSLIEKLPYQVAAFHRCFQHMKLHQAQTIVELAGTMLPESTNTLYSKKIKSFQQDRILYPSLLPTPLNEQSLELTTPTAAPFYVSSLASLNMLVIGCPNSGVSTLLGNWLYSHGRLPYSLVKPKSIPPFYWEQFNGQQFANNSISNILATNPLQKLNSWNMQRNYNYKNYTHCFYTNRYKINVMHQNMAGLIQQSGPNSAAQHATSSSSAPKSSPTASPSSSSSSSSTLSPQQTNVCTLAALQADFIVLVIDASSGASFQPTPSIIQQLLIAHSVGVRQIILALTKMEGGGAAWSEKRVQATLASVVSSTLKPLGFSSDKITVVPCSGLTGENLLRRSNKDLCSWYKDGPTLTQAVDRIILPAHRQVETLSDRKLVLQVMEKPTVNASILNDELLDSVRVKVSVLSGLLLHSEPVALLPYSNSSRAFGPVGARELEKEIKVDSRDLAVYLDDEQTSTDDGSASSSTAGSNASDASTKKKITHSADGKKLSNAERKEALAAAKREHARQVANQKKNAKTEGWMAQQKQYEEMDEEQEDGEADADAEADPDQADEDDSSSAALSNSISTTVESSPLLTVGDTGYLTLTPLRAPQTNADDELRLQLTGKDDAQLISSHSGEVLKLNAPQLSPGDQIVLPVDNEAHAVRYVQAFKAEVLALTTWSESTQLKAGQGVTLIPLRTNIPSPASITPTTATSLSSMCQATMGQSSNSSKPLGSALVMIDRLLNIVNKVTRAAAKKKPEYLCGASIAQQASTGCDIASVEFSCKQPLLAETFAAAGPKLANFLMVHQDEVIALVTVTHIMQASNSSSAASILALPGSD